MKELLFSVTRKDFDIDYFRAGGKGGQNANKVESGVRFRHRDSGAVGESREERDQIRNKKIAFNRCVASPKFQSWLKLKSSEAMLNETIDQQVDRLMDESNIRTEAQVDGKWTTVRPSDLKEE